MLKFKASGANADARVLESHLVEHTNFVSTLASAVGVSSGVVVVHRLSHATEAGLAHGWARSHRACAGHP